MELIFAHCGISFQPGHTQNKRTFPPPLHRKISHPSTETRLFETEKLEEINSK